MTGERHRRLSTISIIQVSVSALSSGRSQRNSAHGRSFPTIIRWKPSLYSDSVGIGSQFFIRGVSDAADVERFVSIILIPAGHHFIAVDIERLAYILV